jgi:hypothetical protein
MPRIVNGIGKAYYGKRDFAENGSYITTEWFVFLFVPIFPLGSFRVKLLPIFDPQAEREYYVKPVGFDFWQVWKGHLILGAAVVFLGAVYVRLQSSASSPLATAPAADGSSADQQRRTPVSTVRPSTVIVSMVPTSASTATPENESTPDRSTVAEPEQFPRRLKPYYSYQPPITVADNGSAFPVGSGYVNGYAQSATDGSSILKVDNSKNDGNAFIKLVIAGSKKSDPPIRAAFIKAGESFTMDNIKSGIYELKYQNLTSGQKSLSQSFELKEDEGIRMTLYKVVNGNMSSHPIGDDEF